MAIPAPTIDADLEAVTAALAGVQPRPGPVLLFGSRARGDARPDSDLDLLVVMPQATLTPQERQQALRLSLMSPAEVALLLLRLAERRLGSLRGTLDLATIDDEDWGFLAQQSLEKLLKALLVLHCHEPPRSHSLQRLLQELARCGETLGVAPELLDVDDFAVLARYDAEPTPLPAERRLLLEPLEAFHVEVRQRLS
jgi:HEPN domain-containing protein